MSGSALAGATIVFDLDGTLVDTAPDLVAALNRTMAAEGLPAVRLETVRKLVGQGARALIERSGAMHGAAFAPERLDALTQRFVAIYAADIAAASRPFPGAIEALDEIAAAGARLAVCTNKRTDLSLMLLDALGLSARFAAIVGADAVSDRKPHPLHYRTAVQRAGGEASRSLMVGDTAADIDAARAAGAPSIAVGFGYCEAGAESLGADLLIQHFSELTSACRRLLAATPQQAGLRPVP